MKRLLVILFIAAIGSNVYGQDAQVFYDLGVEKAQAGALEEAEKLFTKSIEADPLIYASWYYRGLVRSMLRYYESAIPDFNKAIELLPDFERAYVSRGMARKGLTDYEGAISDYNYAIKLKEDYPDPYFNRGVIYELFGKTDSACRDFERAKKLDSKEAIKKTDKCKNAPDDKKRINAILSLIQTAEDGSYGFTEQNPVKAGTGPDGGPGNQRAYLDLLRDASGNPVNYKRVSSCCAYKSDNGFMGMAMLDKYEVTYKNNKGEEAKAVVYISFYDYEQPKILSGFKTVQPYKN